VVSSGNVVSTLLGLSCQLRGRVRGWGLARNSEKGDREGERERERGRERERKREKKREKMDLTGPGSRGTA